MSTSGNSEQEERPPKRRPDNPPRVLLFLAALLAIVPGLHAQAPQGKWVQAGLTGFPGLGIQLGYVDARGLYTREVNIVADFKPAGSRGSVVVAATLGGAIRLLGIERTIGNAAYRGYDLDLGLRIGPGLVFQISETRASKNKRFDLFLEPFLRFSSRKAGFVWFLEAGTHRPVARAGLWFPL